jgi:hypothetical protein
MVGKVNRTRETAKFYPLTKERINGSANLFRHQVEKFARRKNSCRSLVRKWHERRLFRPPPTAATEPYEIESELNDLLRLIEVAFH